MRRRGGLEGAFGGDAGAAGVLRWGGFEFGGDYQDAVVGEGGEVDRVDIGDLAAEERSSALGRGEFFIDAAVLPGYNLAAGLAEGEGVFEEGGEFGDAPGEDDVEGLAQFWLAGQFLGAGS